MGLKGQHDQHLKNETGKRYGRWTVIAFSKVKYKRAYWLCKCDCGTIREVGGTTLRNEESISCGCYRIDGLRKPENIALLNRIVNRVRQSAKIRHIAYRLTPTQVEYFIHLPCNYCGHNPDPVNGIDRVDSTKPYIFTNCVSACWPCNDMKSNRTETEFITHCRRVAEFCNSNKAAAA